MHSWCCSCDTVRLRTTWNDFSFAVHLSNIPQEKKCLRKQDSFTKKHQLSRTHCVFVCADGASAMIRTEKALWICEKGKQKYLRSYCLLCREKNQTDKKFKKIWQFFNRLSAVNHFKSRPLRTRLFGTLGGEMGADNSVRLFHLNIRWLMRKDAGESVPRNATGALLKEQNHIFAERFIDSN